VSSAWYGDKQASVRWLMDNTVRALDMPDDETLQIALEKIPTQEKLYLAGQDDTMAEVNPGSEPQEVSYSGSVTTSVIGTGFSEKIEASLSAHHPPFNVRLHYVVNSGYQYHTYFSYGGRDLVGVLDAGERAMDLGRNTGSLQSQFLRSESLTSSTQSAATDSTWDIYREVAKSGLGKKVAPFVNFGEKLNEILQWSGIMSYDLTGADSYDQFIAQHNAEAGVHYAEVSRFVGPTGKTGNDTSSTATIKGGAGKNWPGTQNDQMLIQVGGALQTQIAYGVHLHINVGNHGTSSTSGELTFRFNTGTPRFDLQIQAN
jgi:hypothetical protein